MLFGTLDALKTLQHFFVQPRARQQQLGGTANHRQRRAQFMTDVSVEFAVTLHHFGQARGIIIQRFGQLPDFVIREAWRQRLRVRVAATVGAQACSQVRYRSHHA
ncbi:hypothetical protein D9M71_747460 [compost metagenome]